MKTPRTLRTWVGATAAVTLLAAACSSDDSSGGAAADEATEDDAAAQEAGEAQIEVDQVALQALLDEWRTAVDTFGATLSLRVPGHDDIHLASGVDDRELTTRGPDGRPVDHTETSMPMDGTYPISAITRTFVAAIALQLVDE